MFHTNGNKKKKFLSYLPYCLLCCYSIYEKKGKTYYVLN